jgi:hypothetical protein
MAVFDTSRDVAYPLAGVLFGLWVLSRIIHAVRPGSQTTPLRGPSSRNILFGLGNYIRTSPDSSVLHERWAEEYGSVYSVPSSLGSTQIMLNDPKAIASFFAQGTVTYVIPSGGRRLIKKMVCLYSSIILSQVSRLKLFYLGGKQFTCDGWRNS